MCEHSSSSPSRPAQRLAASSGLSTAFSDRLSNGVQPRAERFRGKQARGRSARVQSLRPSTSTRPVRNSVRMVSETPDPRQFWEGLRHLKPIHRDPTPRFCLTWPAEWHPGIPLGAVRAETIEHGSFDAHAYTYGSDHAPHVNSAPFFTSAEPELVILVIYACLSSAGFAQSLVR